MISAKVIRQFRLFATENGIIPAHGKILLGVSGGADSVLMACLFKETDIPFDIAHINFMLRGHESNEDEAFVREFASKMNVECFVKSFNTLEFAANQKISVEMAARELRNKWFAELKELHGYVAVALGHHKNDHVETILLNLVKGTSIRGLRGMKVRSGIYIRPMLFTTRDEIISYAMESGLKWRTDSTNTDIRYQRNLIRSNIIPQLKLINPSIEGSMYENSFYLGLIEKFLYERYSVLYGNIVSNSGSEFKIKIAPLISSGMAELFLFEFLKPYRFNSRIIRKIYQSLNSGSGRIFRSANHELLIDRGFLILSENPTLNKNEQLIIHEPGTYSFGGREIIVENAVKPDNKELRNPSNAFFDTVVLLYPLIVRYWKAGDYFYPFGMNNAKKLSDFFIDEKIPLNKKRQMMVVESEGEICWIVGMRIDNRFRIEDKTRYIVKLSVK